MTKEQTLFDLEAHYKKNIYIPVEDMSYRIFGDQEEIQANYVELAEFTLKDFGKHCIGMIQCRTCDAWYTSLQEFNRHNCESFCNRKHLNYL